MSDYEDLTDCPICPQLAGDRDDALADCRVAQDEAARWEHIARHIKAQSDRWQEMAEDLWEELQEWHDEGCPSLWTAPAEPAECTCHRILATKWDEITCVADYADDEEDA